MSDDARKVVLARRARFVAAAIAGIAAASCDDCNKPTVCLSVAPIDASAPGPCLSVAIIPDAGEQIAIDAGDAGVDATAGDAGKDAGKKIVGPPPPPPQPCLSMTAPPQPCLKPPPPQVCLEPPF